MMGTRIIALIRAKAPYRKSRFKTFLMRPATQRAQYPLIKEYGLNYIGLHIMI